MRVVDPMRAQERRLTPSPGLAHPGADGLDVPGMLRRTDRARLERDPRRQVETPSAPVRPAMLECQAPEAREPMPVLFGEPLEHRDSERFGVVLERAVPTVVGRAQRLGQPSEATTEHLDGALEISAPQFPRLG